MKKRFTNEQIIQMIKEQEAGERTADVCRRHGISQGTFYKYKSKYGGMEPILLKNPEISKSRFSGKTAWTAKVS